MKISHFNRTLLQLLLSGHIAFPMLFKNRPWTVLYVRSLHSCQKMSHPSGTEILLLYVKKHCKQKPQSLGTTTSFTILVLFLRLCKKHLPKIEAQFLARPFSCHILRQFIGMPHQTGLKCDLKNSSANKKCSISNQWNQMDWHILFFTNFPPCMVMQSLSSKLNFVFNCF